MTNQLSVLLSLYHKEDPLFLRQCLDSIFNQTLSSSEVVLVIDGPLTDDLESVVNEYQDKYSELKIVPLSKNMGLGKALNEGLKYCSFELVARMDTDDIARPDRFERQWRFFKEHPEYDVVGTWIDEFIDIPSNIVSVRKLPEKMGEIKEYAKYRNPLNHGSVMFKKSKVLEVGSYQHFSLMEDYYLWIRMLLKGAVFYNIQESLVLFRSSKDMYNRRGGLRYALTEISFFRYLYSVHYINLFDLYKNVIVRFSMRVVPNRVRAWGYKFLLRK